MSIESGLTGYLAKITAISEDGSRVYFDLRNGNTGSFHNVEDQEYSIGEVLLIADNTDNYGLEIEKVPNSAWPDALWVGIVKIKLSDITVIDSGGRFRVVPTVTTPCYDIGNTVQAGDVQGVTRVLSETPIKYIDLPEVDDSVIDQFRLKHSNESGLGFDDFGGLPKVVARARELIEVPLANSESLSTIGARPIKGVLFTGEPGTGKTMLARIIASQSEATFYEISGPVIFSKWTFYRFQNKKIIF